MTSDSEQRPQDAHWWLSSGVEYCPYCEASWHAEALVYCIACDRPICHVCVGGATNSTEVLCVECEAESRQERTEET